MKKNHVIRLFSFSHLLVDSEVPSLLGDKFFQGSDFTLVLTRDLEKANVIAWDGIVTKKNKIFAEKILNELKNGKALLLLRNNAGESPVINLDEINYVELPAWSVLPEELMIGLMECHKKLKHV